MHGIFESVGREGFLWSALLVLAIVCLRFMFLLRGAKRLLLDRGSPLHQLNLDLQNRGHASAQALLQRNAGVVRIVLTGGPCAGKSSAVTHIIKSAKAQGFDVYTGPETATLLMNCGIVVPETVEGLLTFQTSILKTQIQIETALSNVVEETGRPSIIIFDRGVMDGKGYIPEETWHSVLRQISADRSIEDIEMSLLSRYDAIVHMVTAADGAEKYYKSGHTVDDTGKHVFRRETAEEALELDAKMWDMWKEHPKHIRVPNVSTFNSKLQEVAQSVVDVARQREPTFVNVPAAGSDASMPLKNSEE